MEAVITTATTFTKTVNFKAALLFEVKVTIYLIWNLVCNMEVTIKTNNKIPSYVLGDGRATIATLPRS